MTKYIQNIASMERYEAKLKESGVKKVGIRFKKETIAALEKYQEQNNFNSLNDAIKSLIPGDYFQ
jgi:hypothetical protein